MPFVLGSLAIGFPNLARGEARELTLSKLPAFDRYAIEKLQYVNRDYYNYRLP
jgi:hypothetical protein